MRLVLIACLAALLLPPSMPPRLLAPGPRWHPPAGPDRPVLAARPIWVWPVEGSVVRRFDPPAQPWLAGHRGVDLTAAPSTVVRAAGAGVVWFAGLVAGRPVVSIAHDDGTRTTYEPVRPFVAAGDELAAGDPIGLLVGGHAGCVEACLHWGLKRGDIYLDPLALVGLGRVRLLPVASRRRPVHRPLRVIGHPMRR